MDVKRRPGDPESPGALGPPEGPLPNSPSQVASQVFDLLALSRGDEGRLRNPEKAGTNRLGCWIIATTSCYHRKGLEIPRVLLALAP